MNELFRDGSVAAEGGHRGPNRHGPWRFFHRNGLLESEGEYDDGVRTGTWSTYSEAGKLLERATFPGRAHAADGGMR